MSLLKNLAELPIFCTGNAHHHEELRVIIENDRIIRQQQQRWRDLLAVANEAFEAEAEDSDMDFVKEEDLKSEISHGWPDEVMEQFYGKKEEEVDPLPSTVYSGTPPRAPTPPVDFSDFSESFVDSDSEWDSDFDTDIKSEPCDLALSDEQPCARRSSPFEEGEHTVTEPPFLTAEWDANNFPQAYNTHQANTTEWVHSSGCYTAQEWMRWAMDRPYFQRPPWVIPSIVYRFAQPELIAYPPTQGRAGPYFRQQVITNSENNHWNDFNGPLRHDLVHHSKTTIPLVPTGEAIDINMKYMVETIFEPEVACVSIQLKDPIHGRLVKLDLWITDSEISSRIAVNHRRMNHVSNDDAFLPGDNRGHYWDME